MTKNKSNIKTDNVDSLSIAQGTEINNEESVLNDGIDLKKKRRKKLIIRGLRILFTIGFFVFLGLFINEVFIQPYKLKKSIEKARDLYHFEASTPTSLPPNVANPNDESDEDKSSDSDTDPLENVTPTPTPDPNRDEKGRLRKFSSLLEVNEDVKGWIRIDNINGENDTKIDYVVVQSDSTDPEYYLSRDWATHDYLKAGSLFLDYTSSLEPYSQNLIIHGHNMTSSDDMFHYLLKYQEIDFLREHPIISFDTIFDEGLWKVFSVYITPGNNDRNDFFPFVKSSFANNRDYLEYLYQIRVRSLFNIDNVDINENDQILTLSTCSYELSNYRTIVVARKVRDGESIDVDTDSITKNKNALYPSSFYKHYGGKAPEISSFEATLEEGPIPWYKNLNDN
ncbi:MAG: class B sortase [Anaerolineaceae bacterium]|nr:MAG: class B sortase [Anaerolineaceae bacterium]